MKKATYELRTAIAESIDELRDKRGWSIKRLAREAGVSSRTLFSLLKTTTDPNLATLEALVKPLGKRLVVRCE